MISISTNGDYILQQIRKRQQLEGRVTMAVTQWIHLVANYAKGHHLYTDRSGTLTNSTGGYVDSVFPDLITVVLETIGYGLYLEGDPDFVGPSRLSKYQWLQPAIEANWQKLIDMVKAAIQGG